MVLENFSKTQNNSKYLFIIAFVIFLISLSSLYFTLSDIGAVVDEIGTYRKSSVSFVNWIEVALNAIFNGDFSSFISKEVVEKYFPDKYFYHPPFSNFLSGITWYIFHDSLGEFKAYRLAPAILFSISTSLLFLCVAKYYSVLAGIFTSLSFIFIPPVFGYAHLFTIDSPIAIMWFLTAYCFLRGIESPMWSVILGIVWGLSLNTKVHAYFIPVSLFLWSFIFAKKKFQNNFFSMFFISPVVLYLTNPFFWYDFVHKFFIFFRKMTTRETFEFIPTSFLESIYDFSLPWYYPFYMVLITIPPLIVIFFLSGTLISLGREPFSLLKKDKEESGIGSFFILNALVPLILTALPVTPDYDGVRLFLPAYYFLAALAGVGFYYLEGAILRFNHGRMASVVILLICLLPSIYSLISIHPFELSYYNSFIGGVKGATESGFETTYWNDAFTPRVASDFNQLFKGKIFSKRNGLYMSFDYYHSLGILRKDIKYSEADYDYYILYFRQGWFNEEDWMYAKYMSPVYTAEVERTPLISIYKPIPFLAMQISSLNSNIPFMKRNFVGVLNCLLKVSKRGIYKFGILSDGEFSLSIDGYKILSHGSVGKKSFKEKEVNLATGFHTLDIESRDLNNFYLAWLTPDGSKGLIGQKNLLAVKAIPHSYTRQ
ncbi:MAG: hypothetical protein A3C43_07250 [Candidatus Schekmanbacteria bacterium RIFCSPHIGHO2_02_FULL_38_11]|nr:MAG: hypothetical protein A3H37_10550 [Candidatus Schekmanbacteria bacterium RIFCSPLOWO2_02_FULL_38_14]OGL53678.1 MAG: hypothetical protein A3C43_07250 [Candidatus Schekmanbacteria bacterium RIFCSPHIGHO2_02_FULL_38_11]